METASSCVADKRLSRRPEAAVLPRNETTHLRCREHSATREGRDGPRRAPRNGCGERPQTDSPTENCIAEEWQRRLRRVEALFIHVAQTAARELRQALRRWRGRAASGVLGLGEADARVVRAEQHFVATVRAHSNVAALQRTAPTACRRRRRRRKETDESACVGLRSSSQSHVLERGGVKRKAQVPHVALACGRARVREPSRGRRGEAEA
jgi:hypothetical protein